MKHSNPNQRDVDECCDKIKILLKEYNCVIEYDIEAQKIILFDDDNKDALWFKKIN